MVAANTININNNFFMLAFFVLERKDWPFERIGEMVYGASDEVMRQQVTVGANKVLVPSAAAHFFLTQHLVPKQGAHIGYHPLKPLTFGCIYCPGALFPGRL